MSCSAASKREDRLLPDELDKAVATTDLAMDRGHGWWKIFQVLQWLLIAAVVVGLVWLGARIAMMYFGFPPLDLGPSYYGFPLPTLLVMGGVADQHRGLGGGADHAGDGHLAAHQRVHQGRLAGAGGAADDGQQGRLNGGEPGKDVVVELALNVARDARLLGGLREGQGQPDRGERLAQLGQGLRQPGAAAHALPFDGADTSPAHFAPTVARTPPGALGGG